MQGLGNRSSPADVANLSITESDIVLEVGLQIGIRLRKTGRKSQETQGKSASRSPAGTARNLGGVSQLFRGLDLDEFGGFFACAKI